MFACPLPFFDDDEVEERVFFLIAGEGVPLTTIKRIIETPNRDVKQQYRFLIGQEDFDETSRNVAPDRVVGLLHSHPIGSPMVPSVEDINGKPKGVIACIYHIESGKLIWY